MQNGKSNHLALKLDTSKSNKIQMLRGLAIIAVVIIHNTPDGVTKVVIRPFLNFCVGLFLFLSGMLSDAGKWNPIKRILKVGIPYAIWALIYVIFDEYQRPLEIPFIYLRRLIIGNSAIMMYYIFVYCEFTLLMPLIDKLARSKWRYWGFAIAPIEIIFMRLIPLMFGIDFNVYIRLIKKVSCLGWFTYYYLGYMIGNNLIKIKMPSKKLLLLWAGAIIWQIAEGYWYYSMGDPESATQLKISAIVSGTLFSVLSYRFIYSNVQCNMKVLKTLGDYSFGIYFSHIAVMMVLEKIPFYTTLTPYPVNAIVALVVSAICVFLGRKILGKYSKYLAL